ncbi:succinate--CoA ligase [Afipia sp. Root123D2]|uniref:succinate--CoA ligase subunit alpha n=1 Tax=Afipia sp. Root123D2 TaxID=1736436 RepID=UPI0006FE3246|nr:succinate--CoA ligase subunit alpha [Afipia sp. Root123D2]KQW18566.1 succinate--CoA ligase [Afipia sp. Root123D2]
MAILVDRDTRVLCQGMTGWAGTHHTSRMMEYGTSVVAGVTPGKGGRSHLNLPVYDTVAKAAAETGANASMIFVPPAQAAGAMIEAIEAEIPLIVAVTERVPALDMVRVRQALNGSRTRLVGPNSQGILAPGVCMIGVMATGSAREGSIGIVSRSASLTSEVVAQVSAEKLGQSTTVGVGGDPIHGIGMVDCLDLFLADPETDGIILIGEIGGSEEQDVAEYLQGRKMTKPIVAFVAGQHAPPERRMGHAGTLTLYGRGDTNSKIAALEKAGVRIARSAHLVGATMRQALIPTH